MSQAAINGKEEYTKIDKLTGEKGTKHKWVKELMSSGDTNKKR